MPMLAACACLMFAGMRVRGEQSSAPEGATDAADEPVTAWQRASWIGLAFLPSALLVAFTTHITTDIASAPFLWVIPLATFLGTFVIVFRDESMIPHHHVLRLHPILVAVSIVFMMVPKFGALLAGLVGFATFVVTTLVAHRALFEARPSASKLTEFYLYMSLGGVLGGMFAGLIAPQLFNTVLEYPLLVVGGLLARPGVVSNLPQLLRRSSDTQSVALALTLATLFFTALAGLGLEIAPVGVLVAGLAAAGALYLYQARPDIMAGLAVGCLVLFCVQREPVG